MSLRMPSLAEDFWTLESGEARAAAYPDSFHLPPRAERENLPRGKAARLIFVIETEDDVGVVETSTERMWVVVSEVLGGAYMGVLTNTPATADPEDPAAYLKPGCEVPFRPEHVIDTDDPPQGYLDALFSEPPHPAWKDR